MERSAIQLTGFSMPLPVIALGCSPLSVWRGRFRAFNTTIDNLLTAPGWKPTETSSSPRGCCDRGGAILPATMLPPTATKPDGGRTNPVIPVCCCCCCWTTTTAIRHRQKQQTNRCTLHRRTPFELRWSPLGFERRQHAACRGGKKHHNSCDVQPVSERRSTKAIVKKDFASHRLSRTPESRVSAAEPDDACCYDVVRSAAIENFQAFFSARSL